MNNKKIKTYLLFVTVLSIWGLIAYRLFGYTASTPIVVSHKSESGKTQTRSHKKEVYELSLDYNDPFLKGMNSVSEKEDLQVNKKPRYNDAFSMNRNSKNQVQVPKWEYLGYFNNLDKGNDGVSVKMNNAYHILREGDTVSSMLLAGISSDSLVFIRDTTQIVIKRKIN
ncbi:MAG: hypothetical protein JEZ03_06385 [Bacteroidales bacterium]|nr:hypothetical protein [Bacteroidales bacterium]